MKFLCVLCCLLCMFVLYVNVLLAVGVIKNDDSEPEPGHFGNSALLVN